MYLEISSMRKPSMGGKHLWVMLLDEATKYKKSIFLKKKNEQVEPVIDLIKALKARHEIQVKIIRCDNAGENLGESVAHAQPSVSQEEEEIQNSKFEHESSKHPFEDPDENDRKPAAKRIKKEPEDEAQSWSQEEMTEKPTPKPWEDKKDYEDSKLRSHEDAV